MNLNKRISKLETKSKGWQPVYMAFIEDDGSVNVSSAKEKFTFPDEQDLNVWAEENGLNECEQIRLIKVRIEGGEKPIEL